MNNDFIICFFGKYLRNENSHYKMRTLPLLDEMKQYFNHCYLNPRDKIISKYIKKKFILIHIKSEEIPKKFLQIKNKLVIWDVIDSLKTTQPNNILKDNLFKTKYQYSNIINCPNCAMKNFLRKKKNNHLKRKYVFIPHNWDPRIDKYLDEHNQKIQEFKTPKIGYLGIPDRESKNENDYISKIDEINYLGRMFNATNIGTFNCLCSLRDEKTSFGKPATKSYVAASFNAIIISHYHEYGVRDLYGDEYPYYIKNQEKSELQNIRNTIDYIKQTYNSDIWNNAMQIAQSVKEKTSIEYVGLQFKDLILQNI